MTYGHTVPSFRVLPASTRTKSQGRSNAVGWNKPPHNKLQFSPYCLERVSSMELGNMPFLPLSLLEPCLDLIGDEPFTGY